MAVDIEQLYRRYGPMVLRRCRRLLGDDAAATDAMHDVFVKLMDRRHRLEDRGLSSLLYTMATHESLDRLRKTRRAPVHDPLLLEIAGSDESSDSLVLLILDRLFQDEAPSTRVLAVLRYVDGLSWEETAQAAGMSVSGVRKRLRALGLRARALAAT